MRLRRAAYAKDPDEHSSWLKIAEEYRRLSELNPEPKAPHI